MQKILIFGLLLVGIIIFGCINPQGGNQTGTQTNTQIANPASTYCKSNGGTLQIVTAEDGSQSGICTLPDGTQCEEWAYYRGECSNSSHKGPLLGSTGPITMYQWSGSDTMNCTGNPLFPAHITLNWTISVNGDDPEGTFTASNGCSGTVSVTYADYREFGINGSGGANSPCYGSLNESADGSINGWFSFFSSDQAACNAQLTGNCVKGCE